ncbi:hypothetical protein SUGI_0474900 [Cryptomeria japonica]|nr:hypothetical protein SUGI_0474900 [Cryptomeria japonica]
MLCRRRAVLVLDRVDIEGYTREEMAIELVMEFTLAVFCYVVYLCSNSSIGFDVDGCRCTADGLENQILLTIYDFIL